jgi:hypothetical protein
MGFMQAAALAAANSTVFRKMASPPRSRSKSPERQDQHQQQHLERNNKIMLMNLRSPMASADWLHARHRPALHVFHDSLAAGTTRGDLLSGHCDDADADAGPGAGADANTNDGADVGGAVAGEGCDDVDAGGVADAGAAEDLRDSFT